MKPLKFLILAYCLAGIFSIYAKEPKELTESRAAWEKAKEQALSEINIKYNNYLIALKLRYTKAGDLDSASAVEKEISNLNKPATVAAAPASTPAEVEPMETEETDEAEEADDSTQDPSSYFGTSGSVPEKVISRRSPVGVWKWVGNNMTINEDGTVTCGNGKGNWTWTNKAKYRICIKWTTNSYVDNLEVSRDGKKIFGTNNTGGHLSGDRIKR